MTSPNSGHSTQISGLLTQKLDYPSVFIRLRDGHTLITANSRLSRVLANRYNQWRIGLGDKQWQSPDIISWNVWVDRLWESAALRGLAGTGRAVPNNRQLLKLWENILRTEPLEHTLLRPESLASQLLETRKLMTDWQLNFNDPAWFADGNENYNAFYRWNKAFEKRCETDKWISPEDRSPLLCDAIKDKLLTLPGAIDLLGFDEFNPMQVSLLKALIATQYPVSNLGISSLQDKVELFKSRDSKTELEHMARWVRYWFEKEPGSTIAIVVHDLQTRRQEVERHLEEVLLTGDNGGGQNPKPWNISMGAPLARFPMIETAFDLLKLLDKRIDIQDIGRVLRSPWLRGAVNERNSRALLEKCLREKYPRQLKLREFKYRAGEMKTHDHHHHELPPDQHGPQPWNSPELTTILNTLSRFYSENRGQRAASEWAESLDALLLRLGWPIDNEATAEATLEHDQNWQALQAWRDVLRELASLDATTSKIGLNTAINQLRQICRETVFQAHTAPANIQVLGLYEVSGLRFDHLWVVGLHNDNWPPGARPDPFIPASLQRAAQTPNSSPQRELEVARVITRRLLETAPDCVFSYPGQVDGEDMLPSPLFGTVATPVKDISQMWQGENWRNTVAGGEKPQLDPIIGPGPLKHDTARGGSSILKHQALCPFRAFASNRLGADRLETPADGISAMLHGSLVHKVLEFFWTETRSQAALLELDEESLLARVRRHVESVTSEDRGLNQRPAFRKIEADRVYRHVLDYLALDKARDSFEVVGFEKEILPEIEGQSVRLVIDRIDRLPSGDEIIIDYKTGKEEPNKWFGDRPENPQLPLYAISAEKTPAGVVFGIVRDDGCEYKGVVSRDGLLPGLPPRETKLNKDLVDAGNEMPKTIENWRQILHRLMSEFLAGEAKVDPKAGLKTCDSSYCDLQSVCRIGELVQRQKPDPETKHQEVSG